MSRLALTFNCQGATLAGTLDTAPGTAGLLLVSGGNEIRSGAFAGQARFAAEIARAGFPVFRFDRRGTGDSEGVNRGFRHEGDDIAAALAAFRAMTPQLGRVVGMGNCDAASALMLAGGARCDALVLSNPWTIEETGQDTGEDSTPPAAAIRARYLAKLKNPREVIRLVSGGVDMRKLLRGVAKAAGPKAPQSTLAADMRAGLDRFEGPVRILLAEADRTAQVFAENWSDDDPRIARCPGAGHAYVEPHARQWLREQVLGALRG
ncbi:MAG: hydrolase 1, exosortase A system-associated [Alphaproteobacteria bacterium]|nr:hydrolase 1, exosortase A system-associated [Alphaproteobacteria bacterium]